MRAATKKWDKRAKAVTALANQGAPESKERELGQEMARTLRRRFKNQRKLDKAMGAI